MSRYRHPSPPGAAPFRRVPNGRCAAGRTRSAVGHAGRAIGRVPGDGYPSNMRTGFIGAADESPPDELVGTDRVRAGDLDDAASFVTRLLREPASEIRVTEGQLEFPDELVVAARLGEFAFAPLEPVAPGRVWAIDGGSCIVADGRTFQVAGFRVGRVRFNRGATEMVESAPVSLRAVSRSQLAELAGSALGDLGEHAAELPSDIPRPVDALREWGEWREIHRTVSQADRGDLVLVDGSLHGGPLVPSGVVSAVHGQALERGVSLAGVVKRSTLFWGRNAPLVALLKRRAESELGQATWSTRISSDPVFGRLYVGEIFVAQLAPTAAHAFRVDVARGDGPPEEVLGRLASLSRDPAFVGYPYPLARAHQAARVTGYGVADLRRAFRDALVRHGMSPEEVEGLLQDFHEVLNRS